MRSVTSRKRSCKGAADFTNVIPQGVKATDARCASGKKDSADDEPGGAPFTAAAGASNSTVLTGLRTVLAHSLRSVRLRGRRQGGNVSAPVCTARRRLPI